MEIICIKDTTFVIIAMQALITLVQDKIHFTFLLQNITLKKKINYSVSELWSAME